MPGAVGADGHDLGRVRRVGGRVEEGLQVRARAGHEHHEAGPGGRAVGGHAVSLASLGSGVVPTGESDRSDGPRRGVGQWSPVTQMVGVIRTRRDQSTAPAATRAEGREAGDERGGPRTGEPTAAERPAGQPGEDGDADAERPRRRAGPRPR